MRLMIKSLSYRIAGIRECYEEADVLFAYEENDSEIISNGTSQQS